MREWDSPAVNALAGLIREIPDEWTKGRRAQFLDAFTKVLDLVVEVVPEEKS